MIKRITLLVAVVALSTAVIGQTTFGIKAGLNAANVKISGGGTTITNKMNLGFMGGVFVNVGINENISFQPELLYAQYGCKLSSDFTGAGSELKWSQNYISVPLMVKYSFGEFNIQAGPQFGYLLSSEVDGEDAIAPLELKKLDIGASLGAGYQMGKIGIEGRYYFGLASITSMSGGTIKNSAFQLLVSYKFN